MTTTNKKNKMDLEEKFLQSLKQSEEDINEQLRIAETAMRKALSISNKTGIPFYTDIIIDFQKDRYIPESRRKLGEMHNVPNAVVDAIVEDETGIYQKEPGWSHDNWVSSSC